MKIRKVYKQIMSIILCLSMIASLVGCGSKEQPTTTDTYVKDDGTVVVDGVEIQDALVRLQVNGIEDEGVQVIDIDVEELVNNSVNIEGITVLETEVVSLNDEFVYLAYQNFVSYYDEDIDWATFIKDVAIGAACVIVCVTLSTVGGPVGTFFGAVICSEFTATSLAIGAAIDAAIAGYNAYQEGGDISYILGHMLNGVAEGFKWAAILAPISGGISGIKALKAVKAMKKLPGFSDLSDKAINQLLKEFDKIAKSAAKTATNSTDDVVRALYKTAYKELSNEITEDMFLAAFRNSDDIIKIIQKFNPFDTAKELTSTLRNAFFEKADIEEEAAKNWIKQIRNKSVKKLDDITDDKVRQFIADNMSEFVQLFGNPASKELIDDCLKKTLRNCLGGDGNKAFEVVKTIISDDNAFCKLIAKLGKESADKILDNSDALLLLQTRYGAKNVNKLINIQRIYNNLVQTSNVDVDNVTKIIYGLLDGSISSIDDITKISSSAGRNAYKSAEAICDSIKNLGIEGKASKFLNDVSAARLEWIVDPDIFPGGSVDEIVSTSLTKKQIIEKFGENAYQELVEKSDRAIAALSLPGKVNNSLIEDLFTDSLSKSGLSDEVIMRIKEGYRISEWGLPDEAVPRIGNSVADYYKAVDSDLYHGFNLEYSELRCNVAKAWNEANGINPINSKYYLGTVMTPTDPFVKAKYGDVYMNTAGYPILDDFAVARVEIPDLTGIEADDIAKANLLHHGTESNIPGYTWHHVEDGRTMILVPEDLHTAYRHSGGAALLRDGVFDVRANELLKNIGTYDEKYNSNELLKALHMADSIEANGGNPLKGCYGGVPHGNYERKLPTGISYKEYDVNPRISGQQRDALRLVIGEDGSVYYTNDHYDSFIRLK